MEKKSKTGIYVPVFLYFIYKKVEVLDMKNTIKLVAVLVVIILVSVISLIV